MESEFVVTGEANVTWLDQETYDRLKSELDYLSGDGRADIAKKIEAAREEGDLKENGGYHAAKDEQGLMEARIRQLANLLKNAVVGETIFDGKIGNGTVVTANIAGDESVFLLGSREIAVGSDLDVYSPQSPIGEAILGLSEGQKTEYTAPNGKQISVEIVKVAAYHG